MALFTLADLHLSLSGEKPMDVFGAEWAGFEQRLKEYWEYLVDPEDTVVIPGDISWAMSLEETKEDFAFINALPGQKILMKGNHDYWWTSLTKMNAFFEACGFDTLQVLHNDALFSQGKILCGSRGWMCEETMNPKDEKILRREAMRFRLSLEKGAILAKQQEEKNGVRPEILCFSHYPIAMPAMLDNPILDVLEEFGVKRVFYGHLHNWGSKPLTEEHRGISFTLVSSDYRRFTPFRID